MHNPIRVLIACFWAAASTAANVDFTRVVRPILSDKCFHCHGPDANTREAKLRLDTFEGATRDLGGYAAVVPGDPDASVLMERIQHHDPDERMPPEKSGRLLEPEEQAHLRQWIAEGATYKTHWAWVPVRQLEWGDTDENPIDSFIRQALHKEGLKPAASASRETLIRRVSLDLTGLPPEAAQVDAFLADKRPLDQAYKAVVERLLASPHYGEHMAYRWLDAARYADSDGFESDPLRSMWPWRDWVIQTFNDNMPYDAFITEQLAGDLLPKASLTQKLASGYNRNNRLNNEGGILAEEWLVENVADRTETAMTMFLGLTWGCARCHDHKYDPITQRDYYQMFSYFYNIDESGIGRGASTAGSMLDLPRLSSIEAFEKVDAAWQPVAQQISEHDKAAATKARLKTWMAALTKAKAPNLPAPLKKKPVAKWTKKEKQQAERHFLTKVDPEGRRLREASKAIKAKRDEMLKSGAKVMVMKELPEPRQAYILNRGAYDQPGEKVSAGVPAWILDAPNGLPQNRLGLAQWLTDPMHPLTARVAVNSFWERYFGNGLVKTMEDFGSQGEPPSHPELLDYLAMYFVDSDWDVKELQRLIVMSETYRQQAAVSPRLLKRDPDNRLLARGPRFRLPAQVIRDQALATSGLLVETIGGPPVKPYQPPGLWKEVIKGSPVYKKDSGAKLYRRSVYTLWRRAVKPPLMVMFDANERDTCKVGQRRTNTPLQALSLLNGTTFVEASRALAGRMVTEGGKTANARISYGVKRVLGRQATASELAILAGELQHFLASYQGRVEAAKSLLEVGDSQPAADLQAEELAAYTLLARILLNLDEFVNKE
jgi:hypothetical protein